MQSAHKSGHSSFHIVTGEMSHPDGDLGVPRRRWSGDAKAEVLSEALMPGVIGRLEIDTNTVERAIRPQTLTRKNALFAGSDGGGRTWATIATMLATARLNEVYPQAWLTLTLERIAAGWPNKKLDDLMPWNHQA